MGYTRYWDRTDKPLNAEFVEGVKKIIKDSAKFGIAIRDWNGYGDPTLTTEKIALNGNAKADIDLSHESFVLDDEQGFCFCKTARKPYDYTVRTILRLAEEYGIVENIDDDGYNEDIYSDEEYIRGWI